MKLRNRRSQVLEGRRAAADQFDAESKLEGSATTEGHPRGQELSPAQSPAGSAWQRLLLGRVAGSAVCTLIE